MLGRKKKRRKEEEKKDTVDTSHDLWEGLNIYQLLTYLVEKAEQRKPFDIKENWRLSPGFPLACKERDYSKMYRGTISADGIVSVLVLCTNTRTALELCTSAYTL